MKVHRSALKHGVSPEDAIQAAQWALWIEPLDEDASAHLGDGGAGAGRDAGGLASHGDVNPPP